MRSASCLIVISLLSSQCASTTIPTDGSHDSDATPLNPSPLTGDWRGIISTGPTTTLLLHLGTDGAVTLTLTGGGTSSCSGTLTDTGLIWSATSTTFSVSGTNTCTGTMVCASTCDTAAGNGSSWTCDYSLSSDNNTLRTGGCHCTSTACYIDVSYFGAVAFTRVQH